MKQITTRINSLKSTAKITKAMYLVSSTKFHKAKESLSVSREYFQKCQDICSHIINYDSENLESKNILMSNFTNPKGIDDLLVVISTAKGLCGSINANLCNALEKHLQDNKNTKLLIIGKKLSQKYGNPSTKEDVINVASSAHIKTLKILYMHFYSSIKYETKILDVFPFGKKNDNFSSKLIEPSIESAFHISALALLSSSLSYTIMNTHLSENAARMIAMDNANKNADKTRDFLQLSYNKIRQAKITNSLIDIVSGMEAI